MYSPYIKHDYKQTEGNINPDISLDMFQTPNALLFEENFQLPPENMYANKTINESTGRNQYDEVPSSHEKIISELLENQQTCGDYRGYDQYDVKYQETYNQLEQFINHKAMAVPSGQFQQTVPFNQFSQQRTLELLNDYEIGFKNQQSAENIEFQKLQKEIESCARTSPMLPKKLSKRREHLPEFNPALVAASGESLLSKPDFDSINLFSLITSPLTSSDPSSQKTVADYLLEYQNSQLRSGNPQECTKISGELDCYYGQQSQIPHHQLGLGSSKLNLKFKQNPPNLLGQDGRACASQRPPVIPKSNIFVYTEQDFSSTTKTIYQQVGQSNQKNYREALSKSLGETHILQNQKDRFQEVALRKAPQQVRRMQTAQNRTQYEDQIFAYGVPNVYELPYVHPDNGVRFESVRNQDLSQNCPSRLTKPCGTLPRISSMYANGPYPKVTLNGKNRCGLPSDLWNRDHPYLNSGYPMPPNQNSNLTGEGSGNQNQIIPPISLVPRASEFSDQNFSEKGGEPVIPIITL